jgi:LPS sulfotransferase NodH
VTAVRQPILLTGMPRSGTTWVARILTASGEVGHVNEPFNLAVSPGTLRVPAEHWYAYVTTENEERYLPALTRVLDFEYPLVRELRRCRSRTDVLHTLKWWRDFVRSRGLRPLVKEPHAVFSAGWFAERLDSDVVVMVREPLAVVSSWKRLEWSFDFTNLLEQPALMRDWLGPFEAEMTAALSPARDLVDRVALLWRVIYSVVADERFQAARLVRHEDLSRDPVRGYAQLYEALGLTFTAAVAKAVEASSSSENPAETSVERPHETRIDSRANLRNWRHRLSDDEIARIRAVTEETAALYYPELVWA